MIRLEFRPAAVADLDKIQDCIGGYDARRAVEFVRAILVLCRRLRDFPDLGRSRSDLGTGIRTLAMQRRVLMLYRTTPDAVVITRVLYRGQDVGGTTRP